MFAKLVEQFRFAAMQKRQYWAFLPFVAFFMYKSVVVAFGKNVL